MHLLYKVVQFVPEKPFLHVHVIGCVPKPLLLLFFWLNQFLVFLKFIKKTLHKSHTSRACASILTWISDGALIYKSATIFISITSGACACYQITC